MGANYSFYVKSIATYAPTFLRYNNSVLAIVPSEITPPVLFSDFPIPRTSFFLVFTMLTNLPSNLNFQGSSDFQRPSLFVKFVPSNFQSWPRNCPSQVICTYCWYCIENYCKTSRFFSRGKISVNQSYEIMHLTLQLITKLGSMLASSFYFIATIVIIPCTINIWKKMLNKAIWADKKWACFWQISLYISSKTKILNKIGIEMNRVCNSTQIVSV